MSIGDGVGAAVVRLTRQAARPTRDDMENCMLNVLKKLVSKN